jgi:hypothetical protein
MTAAVVVAEVAVGTTTEIEFPSCDSGGGGGGGKISKMVGGRGGWFFTMMAFGCYADDGGCFRLGFLL